MIYSVSSLGNGCYCEEFEGTVEEIVDLIFHLDEYEDDEVEEGFMELTEKDVNFITSAVDFSKSDKQIVQQVIDILEDFTEAQFPDAFLHQKCECCEQGVTD